MGHPTRNVSHAPRPMLGRGRVPAVRVAAIMAILVVLAGSTLLSSNPTLLLIVAAMAAVCFLPTLRDWQRGTLDVFAPINVICYLWFVFFGLGSYWVWSDPEGVAYDKYIVEFVTPAAWYCLLGICGLLVGYYLLRRPGPRRAGTGVHTLQGAGYLGLVMAIGAVGGFGEVAGHRLHALSQSAFAPLLTQFAQLAPVNRYAWALSWILFFSGMATRTQRRLFLYAFLPFQVLIVATSLNDKSVAGSLAGIPLVALWYTRRRLPWRSLVALGLVLIFVVFPVFNTFRTLDPRIPFGQRIELTGTVIGEWSGEHYLDESVGVVKARLSLINSVAAVVRDVPRWVPYAEGRTLLLPTVAFFIPRVLWPDKPKLTMGTEFAKTFRVTHMLDHETTIAVTVPGEFYWNFSWPGVVAGMFLWGLLLRWLYRRYYEGRPFDPLRVAILIVVVVEFAHFGASVAAQLANLVRVLLLIELMNWACLRLRLLSLRAPPTARTAAE